MPFPEWLVPGTLNTSHILVYAYYSERVYNSRNFTPHKHAGVAFETLLLRTQPLLACYLCLIDKSRNTSMISKECSHFGTEPVFSIYLRTFVTLSREEGRLQTTCVEVYLHFHFFPTQCTSTFYEPFKKGLWSITIFWNGDNNNTRIAIFPASFWIAVYGHFLVIFTYFIHLLRAELSKKTLKVAL